MKIGLLSDTHGWLDSKILDFFKDCDEVWHCGDIGDLAVTDRLAANFNLRAVYGNIDGGEIRTMFAPTLIFDCEGVKTVMTHIGGYPGHYDAGIRTLLYDERPQLFVCGHSHILKVMFDKTLGCLHIDEARVPPIKVGGEVGNPFCHRKGENERFGSIGT